MKPIFIVDRWGCGGGDDGGDDGGDGGDGATEPDVGFFGEPSEDFPGGPFLEQVQET